MRATIARYRDLLVAHLGVLEEEIRLAEAHIQERVGDYRYVVLENMALIQRHLANVRALKARFQAMDIDQFQNTQEFKDHVLAGLQELYDSRPILRAAVRIVMECVRHLPEAPQGPP